MCVHEPGEATARDAHTVVCIDQSSFHTKAVWSLLLCTATNNSSGLERIGWLEQDYP